MKILFMISIILTTIIQASNGLYLMSRESNIAKIMIEGNTEKCSIKLSSVGDIVESDCRIMTNSKNIKIFCTRRKKICKTFDEVYNYMVESINSQVSSNQQDRYTSYQICLDNATSTFDMKICNVNELEYQDRLLNRYYREIMRKLSKDEKQKLKKAQRAWIKYRDAKCDAEGKEMRGGTGESLLIGACLVETTKVRVKELRDMI